MSFQTARLIDQAGLIRPEAASSNRSPGSGSRRDQSISGIKMNNKDKWTPSKFVYKNNKLIGSRSPGAMHVGSRLMADIVAAWYDTYLPQYAKGKLVDLGCGKVPLFEAYRDYVTDNICVDWENTRHQNEYLDYECDLSQDLPFPDGEFDTIILSDVLEHIPQPEKLWQEMSRILQPQGVALINVPFFYCLHEAPYDFYRYSEYALRRMADLAGFRIIILKPLGGTPEILADMLAKHFQFVPVIGKSLAIAVQSLVSLFGKTTPGQKISAETSQAFPLGYFLIAEKIDPGSTI
jgi:SAM-dependent methyltransferase